MIDNNYGVSFSVKQCRSFGIDPGETLDWLLNDAGFRRFRLMSYWNEHEPKPGEYDFSELDRQFDAIEAAKTQMQVSLCLGARQPRWPENHWPEWAWKMSKEERTAALLRYVEIVVKRYAQRKSIVSYQLENEAVLAAFGERVEIDRQRLKDEYALVKKLDPSKPVIMTTSASWGIPIRAPIPDIVGFSYYYTMYQNGRYSHTVMYPWYHRVRILLIRLLHHKPVFVHELQLEPWGPQAIWHMSVAEQDQSVDVAAIARNLRHAKTIRALPIDIWGAEWWYWRHLQGDESIWQAVRANLSD